jgi:transposase
MHIRTVKVHSAGKVCRYAQLVQSIRKNGKPTHKLIASLGQLSDAEIANFKLALEASRQGKALILPEAPKASEGVSSVLANYRYLDAAVLFEMWNRWGLTELFNQLIPRGDDLVEASLVICALTLRRCIEPGTTVGAEEWFQTTALPELLGIKPDHFNNSRFHRVLEELDRVDGQLQEELPLRYQAKTGPFSAIYMDVTDTWFEGNGCDMAEYDKTKEGIPLRKKIGIVLVCNDLGFPLRWKVIPGKVKDKESMTEMLGKVKSLPWAANIPLVCDRAMGHQASIADFLASGLRFITATTRQEMESFTDKIPWHTLDNFEPREGSSEAIIEENITEAGKRAEAAGFQKLDDRLYILDLGLNKRELASKGPAPRPSASRKKRLIGGAVQLMKAKQFKEALSKKEVETRAELAKREGISRRNFYRILHTLKIHASLQKRILAGDFGYIPQELLAKCAKMKNRADQEKMLETHGMTEVEATYREAEPRKTPADKLEAELRLVTYFNPEMFVNMRLVAREHQKEIETVVSELNKRLRSPGCRLNRETVCNKVLGRIEKLKLLGVYSVEIVEEKSSEESQQPCFQIQLHFNKEEWQRRRRYDGFVLLVAHPGLPHSAVEIVRCYHQKDKVEKDFRTIKSEIKLRPVWHRTDPKVRAHVTLCILALLLERTLEYRLRKGNKPMSAPRCIDVLKTCHLNLKAEGQDMKRVYEITTGTKEQQAVLKSLGVKELLDGRKMASRIYPR